MLLILIYYMQIILKKNQIKSSISEAFDSIPTSNDENDPYVLIKELDLVIIYLLTYVKQSVKKNIKNVDTQIIKSRLMEVLEIKEVY